VNQPHSAAEEAAIRRSIDESRPYGTDRWIARTMGPLGWREPGKPGRPGRTAETASQKTDGCPRFPRPKTDGCPRFPRQDASLPFTAVFGHVSPLTPALSPWAHWERETEGVV
jgi:hypothetical protein